MVFDSWYKGSKASNDGKNDTFSLFFGRVYSDKWLGHCMIREF